MRTFKIVDHNLETYQHRWVWWSGPAYYEDKELTIGTRVCSLSKLETTGIIVDLGPKQPQSHLINAHSLVKRVTVLWLTGRNKGKKEIKDARLLANFDSYKQSILDHLHEIEVIEAEGDACKSSCNSTT